MIRKRSAKRSHEKRCNRGTNGLKGLYRHPCFEPLESRQLLSVTLPVVADQTVLAGAPLNLALDGGNDTGNPISYTISLSKVNLTNPGVFNPQLTATVPQGNPSLRITV
jgi:hypothetical protein